MKFKLMLPVLALLIVALAAAGYGVFHERKIDKRRPSGATRTMPVSPSTEFKQPVVPRKEAVPAIRKEGVPGLDELKAAGLLDSVDKALARMQKEMAAAEKERLGKEAQLEMEITAETVADAGEEE